MFQYIIRNAKQLFSEHFSMKNVKYYCLVFPDKMQSEYIEFEDLYMTKNTLKINRLLV